MNNYYGKYRARVVSVDDPEKRGRIRVVCPKVLGEAVSNWCEPCSPVAYDYGGDFCLPLANETVWVEFEEGNVNKPIWVGGWWSTNCSPSIPYDTRTRIINWDNCTIEMTRDKMTLSVGGSSIEISANNIKLNSNRIDLN